MEILYPFLGISGLIFTFMGFIFLLLSRMTTRPGMDWLTTEGKIIQKEKNYTISLGTILNREGFISNQPDSAPTFHYVVNGIEYEKTSRIQQKPGFQIGSTVEILYDPNDPQQAVINTFIQKGTIFNLIGKILFIFGAALLSIGLLIFIFN